MPLAQPPYIDTEQSPNDGAVQAYCYHNDQGRDIDCGWTSAWYLSEDIDQDYDNAMAEALAHLNSTHDWKD